MNDVVALAMERAERLYGDRGDGLFNAAGFSSALMVIAGLDGAIDGRLVRVLLTGRADVEPLGEGMFRRRCPT